MNKLPTDLHTYISDFITYKDLLTSFKSINKYFNSLKIRDPKLPHKFTITYHTYWHDEDSLKLNISIDGEFKWSYDRTYVSEAGTCYYIEDIRFGTYIPNGEIYNKNEERWIEESESIFPVVTSIMDNRLILADNIIKSII